MPPPRRLASSPPPIPGLKATWVLNLWGRLANTERALIAIHRWRNAANNKHGNYSRGSWICVRRSYRRTRQNERYLHNWCGAGDYSYLAPYHNWPDGKTSHYG